MTNAAPQHSPSLPTTLAVAELNLQDISLDDCDVVLLEEHAPIAHLSLSLAVDGVHELRVRVELPERSEYTLRSRLYAMSVEHVSEDGRTLPLDADLQLAVCAWCENDRAARVEIERAWTRAERWQREADASALWEPRETRGELVG